MFHCFGKAFFAVLIIVAFTIFAVEQGFCGIDNAAVASQPVTKCVCPCHVNVVHQQSLREPTVNLLPEDIISSMNQDVKPPLATDIFRPPIA